MGAMTKTSFGDQLQQMWHTRPVRLPRQGPIAGVAAGFGQRYGVDPVLVRVALVVTTIFGGSGVVLYLLAWLLFPEAGESSAAEALLGKGRSSQSTTKTVVLIVALAIVVSAAGPVGVGFGGSGVIGMALLLAGWWMLHMRTPQPPPGTSALADGPYPDSGLNATGYPGAVFPMGHRNPGDAFANGVPRTDVYSPYTKLPDSYVPDNPVVDDEAKTTVLPKDNDTVLLTKPESSAATTTSEGIAPGKTPDQHGNDAAAGNDAGPRSGGISSAASSSIGQGRTPPSWDPLGVAPLAWDLPDPTPVRTVVAPPQPKRPRSRLTAVVIGLAILAAAAAGAVAASGVEWMTPGRIGAVALAVLGLGMVAGAFLRRGYGLLVLAAPLTGFVILASLAGPIDLNGGEVGDRLWAPSTMADLQPRYDLSVGEGTLDLRSLHLTENYKVDVTVKMGEARILVPDDMTVRTTCHVRMGDNSKCPAGITGPNKPNDPVLDLNINVRTGSAEVQRGR
ncbi:MULTISPECIES: PspC domain-containing protein [unclassified Nocardia]|uniref:PspC domain-containing protein n=1 Tax=unclassified Nocardia TaxID=2637762 RepID=UPI001CE3FA43|nr:MULTISPECIES: PspC domain-containing protein [unclassified Nocardia]